MDTSQARLEGAARERRARRALALAATVLTTIAPGVAAAMQAAPPSKLDYSALGDSFSAGEGVRPYEDGTNTKENSCHRSERAYSHSLHDWLENEWTADGATESFEEVDLDFLACSGALMRHVDPIEDLDEWHETCGESKTGVPCGWMNDEEAPQLVQIEDDADLVTITISGNDAHFADVLTDCFAESDCRYSSPTWVPSDPATPTEECIAEQDTDDYGPFLDGAIDCLSDELEATYRAVQEQAPNAAILVLSYPQLFPDSHDEQNCQNLDRPGVQLKAVLGPTPFEYGRNRGLAIQAIKAATGMTVDIPGYFDARLASSNFPFSNDEQTFLREKTLKLNEMVEEAAEEVGVHFVDVDPLFAGHEICGDAEGGEWISGIVKPELTRGLGGIGLKFWENFSLPGRGSFHPNGKGQQAYATAVQEYLLSEGCGDLLPTGLPANPGDASSVEPSTSMSLVIDTSESMSVDTDSGEQKIDAARRAASDVVTLAESDQTDTRKNQVGLVEFNTRARVLAPLSCSLGALKVDIDALYPRGDTNLGQGLQFGIDQVAEEDGDKAVILLSDGVQTEGLSNSEILASVVPDAVASDVRVFTIGFGSPDLVDDIDEDVLRDIARRTGGAYGYASSPFKLRSLFIRARQGATGTIAAERNGFVAQDETQRAASWSVGEGEQGVMEVALAWPGSDLDIVLEDPAGEVVDADYEGARISADQNPEVVEVAAPAAGEWTVRVAGKDVPAGVEEYYVVATTNEGVAPAEPRRLLPLFVGGGAVAVLVLGGIVAWRVARTRRRRRLRTVCPGCGKGGRTGARFCAACGTGLVPVCPECKTAARTPSSAFCGACGSALVPPEPPPRRQGRRRAVAAIALVLVLGGVAAGVVAYTERGDGRLPAQEPVVVATPGVAETSAPAPLDDDIAVASWRFGPDRTGAYAAEAPQGAPSAAWVVPTRGSVDSSPAVAYGAVFEGSDDGDVYAIDQETGEELWQIETGGPVNSSPAVSGGRVIVGSYDGGLYSIDAATGEVAWIYETGDAVGSSPVVADGAVFAGSDDGCVYSIEERDGAELWTTCTGGAVFSSPAVTDESVFVGSVDGNLYALDRDTGDVSWTYETNRGIVASPAVTGGVVYFGSKDGRLYAVDADSGSGRWTHHAGSEIGSSPAITRGRVYFGTYDGDVVALGAATGRELWRRPTRGLVFSSPAVVDGVVYVGSYDGYLYALDTRGGNVLWRYDAGRWVNSTPAIHDGRIYFGTDRSITALT